MPSGKAPQLCPGDVVVVGTDERDVVPRCEAVGVTVTQLHRMALGRSGAVVAVEGDKVAVQFADATVLSWPVSCLSISTALPARLHNRSLICQVKQRRGKSLKALQEEIRDRPNMVSQYSKSMKTAMQNERKRVQMMWAADAKYGMREGLYSSPLTRSVLRNRQK